MKSEKLLLFETFCKLKRQPVLETIATIFIFQVAIIISETWQKSERN